MKLVHKHGSVYTLNASPHEDVVTGVVSFVEEHGVEAAHITGLGAAEKLNIAYYNLETKEYERTTITENIEILSLTGNIDKSEEGKTIFHLHGVFGRRDLSTFGGHLFSLIISGAGEIHLTSFPGTIARTYDESTGLNLMCDVDIPSGEVGNVS